MKVFLLGVLLAACEGQTTTKHRSVTVGSSCFIDQSVQEQLKILKEELIKTNAKLQAMERTQQSQRGRLHETSLVLHLFGVLHRFQQFTGRITIGSSVGRESQYIQLVKSLYCKLLTISKHPPTFPHRVRGVNC